MRSQIPLRPGFTLVECTIALVVLALAVMATAQALLAGQAQTYRGLYELRAQALAEALMEEILAQPCVPQGGGNRLGPEAGEVRLTFNSVDDFHGFTETSNRLKDAGGTLYGSDYQKFNRTVTVVYGNGTLTGCGLPVAGATVTVTVTDARGGSWSLSHFVVQ